MGGKNSRSAAYDAIVNSIDEGAHLALLEAFSDLKARREQDGIDLESFRDFTTPLSSECTVRLHKFLLNRGLNPIIVELEPFVMQMTCAMGKAGTLDERLALYGSIFRPDTSSANSTLSGSSSSKKHSTLTQQFSSTFTVQKDELRAVLTNLIETLMHLNHSQKEFETVHNHHVHGRKSEAADAQKEGHRGSSGSTKVPFHHKVDEHYVNYLMHKLVEKDLTDCIVQGEPGSNTPAHVVEPEVPSEVSISLDKWIPTSLGLEHLLSSLFRLMLKREVEIGKFPASLRVEPSFSPTLAVSHHSELLTQEAVWFLNGALPFDCRKEWRRLYLNREHGDSFNRFTHHIERQGPTLIIIRDKSGHVFGGFAYESWKLNSQFYGTNSNFLFSLSPKMRIYQTTGYNQNYMYYNNGMQTLPNGIGFGGQFDYFALWIQSSFLHGHCKGHPLSSTYGNPQLSGKQDFDIDVVECWGVGPILEPDEDEINEKKKKGNSVLDKLEERAFMEMAGKASHSAGIREKNILDDEDEAASDEEK